MATLKAVTADTMAQVVNSIRLMQQERNRRRRDMGLDSISVIPDGFVMRTPAGMMLSEGQGPLIFSDSSGYPWWKAQVENTAYYQGQLAKYPLKQIYMRDGGGGKFFYSSLADDFDSTIRQIVSDKDSQAQGLALIPEMTLDGIVPYVGQRLLAQQLKETWGTLAVEESQQVNQLLRTKDEASAALISQGTVTDPLGTALLHNILGSVVVSNISSGVAPIDKPAVSYLDNTPAATVLSSVGVDLSRAVYLPTSTNVKANVNLPSSPYNVLTQEQESRRQLDIAASSTARAGYEDPIITEQTRMDTQAADLDYWKQYGPSVKIRPEDNRQLDQRFLYEDWPPGVGQPPLVNVQVTPQQKAGVTMGFLGSHSWVGSIAGLIPVVGSVVALGISIEAGRERDQYLHDFMEQIITPDRFQPQMFPKPFNIVLPLDMAQQAVYQPYYVVPLLKEFQQMLKSSQLATAQQIMDSVSPSSALGTSRSGLPSNLTPGAVTSTYQDASSLVGSLVNVQNRSGQGPGSSFVPSASLVGNALAGPAVGTGAGAPPGAGPGVGGIGIIGTIIYFLFR